MGLALLETFNSGDIVQPVQEPGNARQDALVFGPSLTVKAGQFIGIKTADKKGYVYESGNADGTQVAVGISMYSFKTDANGLAFPGSAGGIVPDLRNGAGWRTMPIWKGGTFDPEDLYSSATLTAQVDTWTVGGTIEIGDIFTLTATNKSGQTANVKFVATATTIANVAAGLVAAWNASTDPFVTPILASGGVTTVVLTAKEPGRAFTVTGTTTESDLTAADTQTFTRAATTPNAGRTFTGALADMKGRTLHNGYLFFPG